MSTKMLLRLGMVGLVAAMAAGCAWPDPAVDDPRGEPVEHDRVYPNYIWTNGSAEPHVVAVVFADTAAEGDGGHHVIEVAVDNRKGTAPVRPVEVTVGGPWRNEGDIEYFPVVSDFALDCDTSAPDQDCDAVATVAPGRVERLRFRGSWPVGESVTSVGIDFSTDSAIPERGNRIDPGFDLTSRPIARADGSEDGTELAGDCQPEPAIDLLATVDARTVVLERIVDAEPRPDAPPRLRLEVRSDGTVTFWDPDTQRHIEQVLTVERLADVLDRVWSVGCGIDATSFALPEVTHVVESVRFLGPDGTLHDVSWDLEPPASVTELAETVSMIVPDPDRVVLMDPDAVDTTTNAAEGGEPWS